ncbi:MAG TPA: nuclear transport factor 2 family protein [Thermoleophilaceae bacterium]|nr:nuclear transport factor 2 family protein [Thermoleophilaceae bacterium]
MSRDNVEVVRAAHEALAAGDFETARACMDPEIEWHGTVGGVDESAVYRGRDEVLKAFAASLEPWESLEIHAERYVDTPGDDVVVFLHEVGRGRGSGVVVENDSGMVNTVRNGRIVRTRGFMDSEQALREAGVSKNLEAAQSIWAAWERGDFSPVEWADPDIEFVQADLPGESPEVGITAMNRAWREFLSSWDGFHIRADEYRELNAERVAVLATFGGRGKHSGVDVGQTEMKGVMAFDFRGPKVGRMVMYYGRDRGLEELGIDAS